ncbi:MAG: hypothetical protein GY796_25740 [Chloroflexi bacterium]|nr:hypothetical protein [Chloroflexota bacterium]
MSDETPNVDDLKAEERLKVEVPVEEEVMKVDVSETGSVDVTGELRNLGRQMVDTLQSAWNSEERQQFEKEVREGMRSFADEIDKAFQDVRESDTTAKVKTEASQVADKVQSSETGQKARVGFANSLQWLSEELGSLATKFTPPEKPTPDAETSESAEE